MSNSFNRIKALLENAGIGFADKGISKGEILAYTTGIDLIAAQVDLLVQLLNIENAQRNQLGRYNSLLNIDESRYSSDDALKNEIIARFAAGFGEIDYNTVAEGFASVGSGSFSFDDGTVIISGVLAGDLPQLGRFIKGYLPFSAKLKFDGIGIDFDAWDSLGCDFDKYDSWDLPFDIIDNLRSDMIEQH